MTKELLAIRSGISLGLQNCVLTVVQASVVKYTPSWKFRVIKYPAYIYLTSEILVISSTCKCVKHVTLVKGVAYLV